MLAKRLAVFSFTRRVALPRRIPDCARCWASFLLKIAAPETTEASSNRVTTSQAAAADASVPRLRSSATWTVDQVVQWVSTLGFSNLAQVEEKLRLNAVDGELLAAVTEEELVSELELTRLQARKILQRLP